MVVMELCKRIIAWMLSFLMSLSSAPVQEIIPEISIDDKGIFETLFSKEDERDPLYDVLLEVNAVLVRYLGTNKATEEEVKEAVAGMDWNTMEDAAEDIDSLYTSAESLSGSEQETFYGTDSARTVEYLSQSLDNRMGTSLNATATNKVLNGKVTITDSEGTGSVSGDVVKITVKGGLATSKTNTVDIYNNTDVVSTLTFNYSASNYKSFSQSGSSGTCSVLLYPNQGMTLKIEAGSMYKEATLTLSNFSLVAVKSVSNVTVEYNSTYGSVTVDGVAVAPDAAKEITFDKGASLVATASGGGKFLGWINPDTGVLLSTSTTYKLVPVADMKIRAVFVGSTGVAYFRAIGGNYLFDNLNNAMAYASSSGYSTVIPANDGTIPAGNYTVPAGITLLIPFDDANTIYTTEPAIVSDAYTKPTAYRTLTMAEGANITVNGALCLPAKHYSAHGSKANGASPTGACPFIKMNSGSNITINSGGNLYAYGYITGSGTVTAKNGANVYEYFQIMDFRGGTQTTDMENGVFPLSQYYIQNIEVPLTLEYGAVESCYASVYISKMEMGTSVAFIAPNGGMFNLGSGSLTKRYDGKTDRLVFELNGTMTISPIELEFGSGLFGASINSKNYEMPINNNITVKVNSGSVTLSQDVAMLPGSELIIGENGKCVIGSNCNVYVYDADQWGNFCGATNKTFIPVGYAPGRTYNRKASDLKDSRIQIAGTLDASNGYLYTTAGGADICGTGSGKILLKKGSQTKTHQLVQNTGYTEIPITAAKLKNADGTYMTPASASSTNYCVDGVWREHTGHAYTEKVTAEATCETAGLKTFTCFCGSTYTESIAAKGHTAGAAATCTTNQTCTVCGKELAASLGHAYQSVTTLPTCTTDGYTTHTCSRCGDVYTDGVVEAKGHTAGAAATCTTNQICTVCGTELAPVKGHNYKAVVTEPTCTTDGYTTHTCSNCGDSYTDSKVAAEGHKAGEEATCTKPQTCTVCGEVLKSENGHVPGAEATCTTAQTCTVCGDEINAALGHDMVHDDAQDATCTEEGYSSGSVCSRCGHTEGKMVIPAKGHTAGAAATCTTNQICTVCGVELAAATGHNYSETITEPTCTQDGYTTHNCLNCGDTYTDSVVSAKGHTKGKAATCDNPQTCVDCGEELAPALGHIPGAAATCTDSQLCLDCGEIIVLAPGHTLGEAASCGKAQVCTVCGEEVSQALKHNYEATVTVPTCTEGGYTTHTCSLCGDSYTDSRTEATGHDMLPATCGSPSVCTNGGCTYTEGKALGHTVVIDEEIPAFCEQSGLTEGRHCVACHAVIVEQQYIPKMGHDIVKHDAKNPTYTQVGWEAYEECTRCSYSTYVEIPMLKEAAISDYETFIENLAMLEELATAYTMEVPGKDPLALVIKYIRTGVDKYNEGSWGIMAGYEDVGFAEFVSQFEDDYNASVGSGEPIIISGLKNLELFTLPNGDLVDFGHMFGTMDITYHNKTSRNHADVAGWTGDLVDLLEFSDYGGVTGTLDEMIAEIGTNYLLQEDPEEIGGFNEQDMFGDLDSLYIMQTLLSMTYDQGVLAELFRGYFVESLTMYQRADYFIKNRIDGISTRANMRDAVYNAYTGNKLITTLEATREFKTEDVSLMRKACCYAFADYICKLAGDYVEVTDNPYFNAFYSETSTLAPGVVQTIKKATSADKKQMVYYTATADLSRGDVHVYANYKDNDPTSWGMQPVLTQANAAQNRYGDPESEDYIENYNVIASINGDGYNMITGAPGGLLVMNGKEYKGIDADGFFGILKDGTAVIGTMEEYNTIYKDQVAEGIGAFGTALIKDGEIAITATSNYYSSRASRTAVGITKTGKVVFMVLDGRQEPISCGGSMIEIAQIMYEAGCVQAVNLDGGGSTTYVAKPAGEDELRVVSKPSDGAARSVSTSLMIVSTAPSSTAFDHAIIESETDYLTKGTTVQLTASGVSATGNAAEIPEGTTWAVSDESWGTVTQDGQFTGLRNGSVDVYLMSGEEILGTKTMNIVVPNQVYFTKTNINATYGEKVELPIKALYENKPVAIQASDVAFVLSNPAAGTFDGFSFTGTEGTGIKNVNITAALTANAEKTAVITVALYNMGEMSFDFDQAVGGDRTLAWYRTVSNSVTDDNSIYEIVDDSQPMVTTYTFAIDMTQIPVPEQLEELTSLLPGAELEGASAWTFLLQLAERVSVLTEVRPTIKFDSNFNVDYSELKILNEYFEHTSTEFDEETNTLTLVLNWIDQTQAIDPEMANPLCLLSGIKLTPKDDAQWTNDRLTPVNKGEISYNAYMRANALYTFAQNPENQKTYGIKPFTNMFNGTEEKGGYFGNVYAEIEDTYTLSKAIKNGWVNEEGGFAYYVDGEALKGVQLIDGFYYDFGESGINVGQTMYTGVFYDADGGVYRYSKFGELTSGWHMIGEDWYYFHADTMAAKAGIYNVGTVDYEFEETGKITSGVWKKCVFGYRYYYGPSYYKKGWEVIDGNRYYFEDTYRYEGYRCVQESNSADFTWYDFGTDGICKDEVIPDGFYTDTDGSLSYVVNGLAQKGMHKIGDDYYCFDYFGHAVTGKYYVGETHCDLPTGNYYFGEDYKALNGLVEQEDGTIIYFENGKAKTKGLVEIDGAYYFAGGSKGEITVNEKKYVWEGNGILPEGMYEFGADGKMLDGIVEKDGILYYYVNGKPKTAGLVKVNGAYYFAGGSNGEVTVSEKKYVWQTTCEEIPLGNYEFGADGKMLDGIVEKDGVLYYYVNGKPKTAGLVKVDGAYYFAGGSNGEITVSEVKYVWETNDMLPAGNYEFGADGKMLNGLIIKDGVLYYYETGKPKTAGLINIDGYYYFAGGSKGEVSVNEAKYVWQTNSDDIPVGTYEFGPDGRMYDGIVEKDGVLYYYVMGKPKATGLFKLDGAYYFVSGSNGELAVSKSIYVWESDVAEIPAGTYEFGADGKMLDGIVEKDGVLYYYNNGEPQTAGLVKIGDDYYFAGGSNGEITVNAEKYVWLTTCEEIPVGTYTFGPDGKMVNGFFEKDGAKYYYVNGKPAPIGLNYVDGYYYFVKNDGLLVCNQSYYAWETNGLSVEMTYVFDENGRVIG